VAGSCPDGIESVPGAPRSHLVRWSSSGVEPAAGGVRFCVAGSYSSGLGCADGASKFCGTGPGSGGIASAPGGENRSDGVFQGRCSPTSQTGIGSGSVLGFADPVCGFIAGPDGKRGSGPGRSPAEGSCAPHHVQADRPEGMSFSHAGHFMLGPSSSTIPHQRATLCRPLMRGVPLRADMGTSGGCSAAPRSSAERRSTTAPRGSEPLPATAYGGSREVRFLPGTRQEFPAGAEARVHRW
jgi:hypothetical protein